MTETRDQADTSAAAIARRSEAAPGALLTDYRLQQRDYLLRIARAMNARLDLAEVLSLVIRSAVTMTAGEAGAIAMRPPGGGEMRLVASYRLEGRFEHDLGPIIGDLGRRSRSRRAAVAARVRPSEPGDAGPRRAEGTGGADGADSAGGADTGERADDPGRETGIVEVAREIGGRPGVVGSAGDAPLATVSADARSDPYHVLTLPLVASDDVVGQIVVFRSEGAAVFTPVDSDLLAAFADQAAVAIQNAWLHERLTARERQLADIVERTPGGILLADADGCVITHNPAARRLIGLSGDALDDSALDEVLALETETGGVRSVALPSSGGTSTGRGFVRQPDGSRGPFVQATVRAMRGEDGAVDGYVADVVDLSAYKEAEDAKTAFLAGLSHELKTPLALIQGFAETLQLEHVRGDRALVDEAVGVILDETAHLTRMVEQLLLAARLQAGALTLDLDVVDVGRLLGQVVDEFRGARRTHRWELAASGRLPELVADPTRLRQVFHNLLSNAAKYAPEQTAVRVTARADGDDVVVAVADEGPGVAPGDRDRIFERFVRATDHAEGTGLGLYMSRAIVEAHGGRIDVEGAAGHGATFVVRLPRCGPGGRERAADGVAARAAGGDEYQGGPRCNERPGTQGASEIVGAEGV